MYMCYVLIWNGVNDHTIHKVAMTNTLKPEQNEMAAIN